MPAVVAAFNLLPTCFLNPSADPGARTTDSSLQDACLRAAAALGRPLFGLFAHPAARVADGAAVLMRAIAECGAAAAAPMRDAALREGALLHHLQLALFAAGEQLLNS
jgi:DnaJ family protein C protein 13